MPRHEKRLPTPCPVIPQLERAVRRDTSLLIATSPFESGLDIDSHARVTRCVVRSLAPCSTATPSLTRPTLLQPWRTVQRRTRGKHGGCRVAGAAAKFKRSMGSDPVAQLVEQRTFKGLGRYPSESVAVPSSPRPSASTLPRFPRQSASVGGIRRGLPPKVPPVRDARPDRARGDSR